MIPTRSRTIAGSLSALLLLSAVPAVGAPATPSGRDADSASPPTAPASVGYQRVSTIAVGSGPQGGVAADVDADGHPDLVLVERWDARVVVLLGEGDGTFAPARRYAVPELALGVEVADLGTDGVLDLAVTDVDGGITILTGLGDGRFTRGQVLRATESTEEVRAADLDGDGRAELVSVSLPEDTIEVWQRERSERGSREGAFVLRATIETPTPLALGIEDVDGDALPDLVVSDLFGQGFAAYLNRGDWSFERGPTAETERDSFDRADADFDGDGVPDAVATNWPFSLLTYAGDGDGGYTLTGEVEVPEQATFVATGDLDGDGTADLISVSDVSTLLATALGRGDGTFEDAQVHDVSLPPPFAGQSAGEAVIADFDGDGVPDLATLAQAASEQPGSVSVWRGTATPSP